MNITQAMSEIQEYVRNWGGQPNEWYIGITANPRERLFRGHMVRESNGDGWIFRGCLDVNTARSVEQQLLSLGFDGGSGGGDDTCIFVYAYKKTNYTTQS